MEDNELNAKRTDLQEPIQAMQDFIDQLNWIFLLSLQSLSPIMKEYPMSWNIYNLQVKSK